MTNMSWAHKTAPFHGPFVVCGCVLLGFFLSDWLLPYSPGGAAIFLASGPLFGFFGIGFYMWLISRFDIPAE